MNKKTVVRQKHEHKSLFWVNISTNVASQIQRLTA